MKYDKYPEPSLGRVSKVSDYEDYIQQRWKEGITNVRQLWREIQEKGYKGAVQSVYRLTSKYSKNPKEKLPPTLKIKAWSARKVSRLLGKDFGDLKEEEQEYLNVFVKHCPDALKANALAKEFKEMTDKLKVSLLDPWIEKAKSSGIAALKNFAVGLENDYDAIKAAVSLEWSNGQVEGQVNRLKMIKRQMYGRASFELLRRKVLDNST